MTCKFVKKKTRPAAKKFALETWRLFITLCIVPGKDLLFKIKLDLCTVVDNFPVTVCFPTAKVDRSLHSFRSEHKNRGELAPSFLRAKRNLPIPA
jgi:hypothetical protein